MNTPTAAMPATFRIPEDLQPGDILQCGGYEAVRLATNSLCGHVAVYIGGGLVVTSLTATGVGIYPIEQGAQDIVFVRRPEGHFDVDAAMHAARAGYFGKPYGWWDCINDVGLLPDLGNGWNCSHTSSQFLEDGGVVLFASDMDKRKVLPRDLEVPAGTKLIYQSR